MYIKMSSAHPVEAFWRHCKRSSVQHLWVTTEGSYLSQEHISWHSKMHGLPDS